MSLGKAVILAAQVHDVHAWREEMTDEEYQRLFPWTAYKQVHTRGDRTVHAFEQRSMKVSAMLAGK